MRRLLLSELPLFSRIYGIQPPDLERMPLREISEYRTDLQRLRANGGEI